MRAVTNGLVQAGDLHLVQVVITPKGLELDRTKELAAEGL